MKKTDYETSFHLYQPPLYKSSKGNWFKDFFEAVRDSEDNLTWDIAAIMSVLSYNYCCGDRTLILEIKRQPWLSRIDEQGKCILEKIPPHGRQWPSVEKIAENLCRLLCNEALEVCQSHREVYLLLSGGLDSRVIAGVISSLLREEKLSCKVTAVTWGIPDSRDVVYGRNVAELLGFEWIHVKSESRGIFPNLELAVNELGCLVPSQDLHSMSWFKYVSVDALVLAGSYGDSVGRGEYSGKHLLELNLLRPFNPYGLIKEPLAGFAAQQIQADLDSLYRRSPQEPKYVHCEHEMQGHYMRGMIAHLMSIINRYCRVYQMFTHPQVYSYMWSLHPSVRDNRIYAHLLEILSPQLARLPWARTNRSLGARTVGAQYKLQKNYHEYSRWIGGPLYEKILKIVELDWFQRTGIFDENVVRLIGKEAYGAREGLIKPESRWFWLASFRLFTERLEEIGKTVVVDQSALSTLPPKSGSVPKGRNKFIVWILAKSVTMNQVLKRTQYEYRKIRRIILKRLVMRKYPPQ